MVSLRPLALLRAFWPCTIHTTSDTLRYTIRTVPHLRQWRFEADAWEMKLDNTNISTKEWIY